MSIYKRSGCLTPSSLPPPPILSSLYPLKSCHKWCFNFFLILWLIKNKCVHVYNLLWLCMIKNHFTEYMSIIISTKIHHLCIHQLFIDVLGFLPNILTEFTYWSKFTKHIKIYKICFGTDFHMKKKIFFKFQHWLCL